MLNNMLRNNQFKVDVVVIGGGVAGASAAIAAARRGCDTLLIESGTSLGGLATNGLVTGIAGYVEGICEEWIQRLADEKHAILRPHLPVIDPEFGKLMLETLLLESKVRILYGLLATDVEVENDQISKVICHGKSGKFEIKAKIYIDTTGDADVAALAGVPCEIGNAEFCGLSTSTTLGFQMTNVDMEAYTKANEEWAKKPKDNTKPMPLSMYTALHDQAVADGLLPFPIFPTALIYPIPKARAKHCDVNVLSTHTFYCRNTDTEDLSRQIIQHHTQIRLLEKFFRARVPGFENSRVSGMANMLGVRESRTIKGLYKLTIEDVVSSRKFDDGITRCPEILDTHHPTSVQHGFMRHVHIAEPLGTAVCTDESYNEEMHPFVRPAGVEARKHPDDYGEIPYRCLVPKKINNLLVAGRCISAEFHATSAPRVIAACMTTGEAAGIAAGLCITNNLAPADVDGKEVRQIMIDIGIPLNQPLTGYWKRDDIHTGNFITTSGDFSLKADENGRPLPGPGGGHNSMPKDEDNNSIE